MLVSLLAVLFGVVALLSIPLDFSFTVSRERRLQGTLSVGWLFGLVLIPVHSAGEAARVPARQVTVTRKAPASRSSRRRHVWAMVRSEGFVLRVARLLRRLLSRLRIRRLRLHVRVGLDDPADTGRLWGVLGPLGCALPMPKGADVALEPEFSGAVLLLDGAGTIRIVPIEIIATLLAFALSPTTWRALRALNQGT